MNKFNEAKVLLEVRDLKTYFKTDNGILKAVDGVSFTVHEGETVGLVGESGCGKSVTNLSIMRLVPSPPGKIVGGEVVYRGTDIMKLSEKELRNIRGNKISMIFQDPMTSLNPYLRISTQMIETIRLHQDMTKQEARERAIHMLKLVGIPSAETKIALDVTIQAQILELIKRISAELKTAVILITHDLGVVAGMCDKVCVMYAGRIVESADTDELYANPLHPYTRGLIASVPKMDGNREERLFSIEGQPPNVIDLPPCCPFHPRCDRTCEVCRHAYPPVKKTGNDHYVACWLNCSEEEIQEAMKGGAN